MRLNVGTFERIGSVAVGAALLYFARNRRPRFARLAERTGTGLVVRGITGFCPVNALLGRNSHTRDTKKALGGPRGVHVLESIVIPATPAEAYRFWRDLSNLPRFMSHLSRVDAADATHSRWIARAPAGLQVEWDAKIINDIENKLIGWKSLEHADVVSAGSVRFRPAAGGTEIIVHLQYDPPGGKLGNWLAEAFGRSPSDAIRQDLRRLRLQFGGQLEPVAQPLRGRSIGRSSRSPHSFHEPV